MGLIFKKFKTAPKIPLFLGIALAIIIFVGNSGMFSKKGGGGDALDSNLTGVISSDSPLRITNPAKARNYWGERIDTVGAPHAYEEFKAAYQNGNFGTQHVIAHIFGEILYDKEGIDGLAICDTTFAFGCYHSFFGKALSEHGSTVASELDRVCVSRFGPLGTGCMHGIGHGLMEYFGPTRLVEALEGCLYTTQVKELLGCTSGVFMEHNSPTVFGSDIPPTPSVRTINSVNPYEPCNTIVPEQFKRSCYYEIAAWWDRVSEINLEEIGILCEEIPGAQYRESCYLGFGNITAPKNNYNVERTITTCKLMPTRNGELLCRAGAAWSFWADPRFRTRSPEVCKELTIKEEAYCIKNSDLIGE